MMRSVLVVTLTNHASFLFCFYSHCFDFCLFCLCFYFLLNLLNCSSFISFHYRINRQEHISYSIFKHFLDSLMEIEASKCQWLFFDFRTIYFYFNSQAICQCIFSVRYWSTPFSLFGYSVHRCIARMSTFCCDDCLLSARKIAMQLLSILFVRWAVNVVAFVKGLLVLWMIAYRLVYLWFIEACIRSFSVWMLGCIILVWI